MTDEELKQIDDTLSTKKAEAFAKNLASEAKKKKARKKYLKVLSISGTLILTAIFSKTT